MSILHLLQASGSWRDNDREVRQDYRRAFDRGAHFIGFTEVYRDLDLLKTEAAREGYHLAWGPTKSGKAETVVAVAKSVQVLEHGSVLVNPADQGRPPSGGHAARYATWVTAEWQRETVTFVEGHWVTAAGGNASRRAKRRTMSHVVAGIVAEHAQGRGLGFVAGDTNDDDNVNDRGSVVYGPLEAGGLVTIFDELGVHPPTHQGRRDTTIDIIASYVPDVRVRAMRVEVHRGGNSDHRQVSAFYDVAIGGRPVKHACPACGLIHRPKENR